MKNTPPSITLLENPPRAATAPSCPRTRWDTTDALVVLFTGGKNDPPALAKAPYHPSDDRFPSSKDQHRHWTLDATAGCAQKEITRTEP